MSQKGGLERNCQREKRGGALGKSGRGVGGWGGRIREIKVTRSPASSSWPHTDDEEQT